MANLSHRLRSSPTHRHAMAPDPKLLYYVKNVLADRPAGR